MHFKEFEQCFDDLCAKQKTVLFSKAADYAADTDSLSNFKFAGSISGLNAKLSCLNLIATKVARLGVLLNKTTSKEAGDYYAYRDYGNPQT